MKKFFITGGSGFIGSAIVRKLAQLGHHVCVLDDDSRGRVSRLSGLGSNVECVKGDVRDAGAVTAAMKGADTVLHLAAVNGTENFYEKPELVLDVGVRGMLAVIDACRANAIRDLVVASSSEVYQTPPRIPTDETVPLIVPDVFNARYSYGGSKILTELVAINYGRTDFDRVVIFRPHNVYGPDMGWEHVIPQFALRAKELIERTPDGPIEFPVQGDGSQTRAFIYIDDFVDALLLLIERGKHQNIYHIGKEEEISMAEVAREVVNCFGRDLIIRTGPGAAGGTPRRCPDTTKLRALGFSAKCSIQSGIKSTVEWYAANADRRPNKPKLGTPRAV